jgi:putative spermidine/putrescine transport system substrate-binding protein/spermidine/putrescine transport system substrate-binding protein
MANDGAERLITRRTAIQRAAFGAAGLGGANVLAACGADTSPSGAASGAGDSGGKLASELNVLVWEGYTDKSFVEPFTAKTGVKVNSTFIGSNDELVAKLRGAPGLYDLVTPSSDTTNLLIDAKQVQPIDLEKVPNAKTSFAFFQKAPNVAVDGKLYGVPMCWGFVPLIYDADAIKEAPTSWNDLLDPKYKGSVSVWQDIALLWTSALKLGFQDPYNLSDDQLNQVKADLLELKPQIRKYWSTAGDLTNLFANKEVTIGMSFGGLTANQLRAKGRNVAEVIPKEGATSWVDNWMITAKSSKVSTCEAFLNHIHDPASQAAIAEATGYGITNQNATDKMPAAYAKAYHLSDPGFISKLSYWQRVPQRQKYLDVLNAVVAK